MVYLLDYFQHRRDCAFKQAERRDRIKSLAAYHGAFSNSDRQILSKSVEDLVQDVHKSSIQPIDILKAYGKAALKAHEKTNCVTEVMIDGAEKWCTEVNLNGPLAGIPISLKDTIQVGGYDTTVGYSSNVGNKALYPADGVMVKLLKDAGAVPYVKTAVPITLLSFESTNDVWGRCTNPHNSAYSPGGSTGGEAALLAAGGSRIGIGSDVAGSVRAPAHFSGIYSLRCSTGRWPKVGCLTSMPGQEGVPSVFSPMTRTLPDLTYFTKSLIGMKPWEYDYTVHPIPWRADVFEANKSQEKFKVGVMQSDGVVDPSPACARALDMTADALRAAGHEVTTISPPSPYEALALGSQLLNADGCRTFLSFFRTFEWNDLGAAQMALLMHLPWPLKKMYVSWVRYVRRDEIWAGLVESWSEKSAFQNWALVAKREAYRARWFDWWNGQDQQYDFLITPVNATPAVPHGGMGEAVSSCGYTFLFNVLDYTCGVMPVTHVNKQLDQLAPDFQRTIVPKLNGVARGAYKLYDATRMHDLPVAVQVVGRRLQEELVLAAMERVAECLERSGTVYAGLEIDVD